MKQDECFAYRKRKCQALNGRDVPRDCENCRFKKPKRSVTNGKVYTFMDYSKHPPKLVPEP